MSSLVFSFGAVLAASIVSAIAAIYANIKSTRATKEVAHIQASLARQKDFTLELLKSYISLEAEGRNQALAAFKELTAHAQAVRDLGQRALERPKEFSPTALRDELLVISNALASAYANHQIELNDGGSDSERSLAHTLKNESFLLADRLCKHVESPSSDTLSEAGRLLDSIRDKQLALRSRARERTQALLVDLRRQIDVS
jgi:hypothetical protein